MGNNILNVQTWSLSQCVISMKMKVKQLSRVRLFVTPVDRSLPGSSDHGILQARIPEWIAIYRLIYSNSYHPNKLISSLTGEGNGNPLQYSCLENPMNRGVWQATVHGVTRVRQDLATKQIILILFLILITFQHSGESPQ